MRLAVVGSVTFDRDHEAAAWAASLIDWILDLYQSKLECVVSGGAVGIDSLGAERASERGIEVVEFLPASKCWPAYKARNILIAERCTHLVRITHPLSRTYGSGWTADYAERIGRPVKRYQWQQA